MLRLACLAALAAPLVAADLMPAAAPTMFKGDERGVTATVDGGRLVLRWAERHTGFHEAYFPAASALPGTGTLTLRTAVAGSVPLWTLSARVRDAKGEVFSFTGRIPAAAGEVSIPIAEGRHDAHWGGNPGTGTMQAPCELIGLAVNGGADPGAGSLTISSIAFATAP